MLQLLRRHPLIQTLRDLRGNPRAALFTEPLWGLSMNLCLPYASVYMLSFGMSDVQVGLIASIYMFSQTIFAFLSGAIIDRYGRRFSTMLFDLLSWSLPCLIWAYSQGFWFFVVAAMLNGMMKITTVSWDCLLVEDAPRDKITHVYSWVIIAGNLSALFAPISSILVARLTLIPAIRILYLNAFVVMTIKVLLLYRFSTETAVGRARQKAVAGLSWGQQMSGYSHALKRIQTSPGTRFAILISILVEIAGMIWVTFWQIIASRRIGVPDTLLPIFPMIKSVLAILLFFTLLGRIQQSRLKKPLYGGFACAIVAATLLVLVPGTGVVGYAMLLLSLAFEALGFAVLHTLRESLVAIHVHPEDRSRVMAILQTTVMLISIPFGYLAGLLSELNRTLPFVLSMLLSVLGILATLQFFKKQGPGKAEGAGA